MLSLHRVSSCLVVGLLAGSLVAGCQFKPLLTTAVPSLPMSTPSATLQPRDTLAPLPPTPTSVLDAAVFTYADAVQAGLPTPSPTPLPDPLRFIFPTPVPEIVSAWRPPLYAVPWAPTLMDHFYFSRPIAADEVNSPSQNYRYGGEFFADIVHTGVDIPAPEGTPVLAVGSGKVIWAGYGVYRGYNDPTDPFGLAVAIRHDFGYQGKTLYTVYGHLQQVDVVPGQFVVRGDPIGLVGRTGKVTGPHLHFEVRLGENTILSTRNPELWLVPPIGWGVIAGQVMDTRGNLVEGQPVIITSQSTGQNWFARSYGPDTVIPDDYYQENLVVGDLPAGKYNIRMNYVGHRIVGEIEVIPGLVRYFRFYGLTGFDFSQPEMPQIALELIDGME